MDLDDACRALGLGPGADADAARQAYRRLVRQVHPDVAGPDHRSGEAAARITQAFAVVQAALVDHGGRLPERAPHRGDRPAPAATGAGPPAGAGPATGHHPADGALVVGLPPDEAFALLHEAGGLVGEIAYVDRHLGLLEVVVRFAGGPTCSVVLTLQGRAQGTEAFLTMASIEADPTPDIAPVVAALAEAAGRVASAWGWDDADPGDTT